MPLAAVAGLTAITLQTITVYVFVPEQPFTSVAAFRERLPSGAALGDEAMYAVASRYFLVFVRARQGDTIAQARALIERGGNAWPRIVWQTIE